MRLKYAVTEINGEMRVVSSIEAQAKGRCFFCKKLFKHHPKDQNGHAFINRHHRIKKMFAQVYEAVTGRRYCELQLNMYWVGVGCHIAFHRRLDPYDFRIARRTSRYLKKVFRRYMHKMRQCNFGESFLRNPAPVPLVHQAYACKFPGGP